MKEEYKITEDELATEYGLSLSNYLINTTAIPMIINIALGKGITRILHYNDNFKYQSDIEKALDKELELVPAFKKLQFQIIYNLVFVGDDNPINREVDEIICSDLRWGKINGFQKNVFVAQ